MSGHSHWARIKRKKGATDAKRGQLFSKCARAITVAARNGGGDLALNLTLRYAIDEARAANMPKDSIERAVKKGTGELADEKPFAAVIYEGYAPGGVAVLVECLTDNRTRTVGEIVRIFEHSGGTLGRPGCVAWMFAPKGVILTAAGADEEQAMDAALAAGADDMTESDDGTFEITCAPENLDRIREALEKAGISVESAEVRQVPQNYVALDEANAPKVLRLMESLEDHDDVQKVHANFDIAPDLLEKLQNA
ncbi:MAG: YebC/PmpR family DNA-binding transcriptional regulator [Phycisphaerae bacterium]